MKVIIKIAGTICLMLLLMAEDCSNSEALQEKSVSEERNRLTNHFQSDFLTEQELFSYQLAAKQKILDLKEYLNILCDTSIQLPFREKAGEMVRNIFISDTLQLNILDSDILTVHDFIKNALSGKLETKPVICDSVWVKKMFYPYSPEMYYSCLVESGTSNSINSHVCNKNIDAWITKQKKVFDTDTLKIWELHLGRIY